MPSGIDSQSKTQSRVNIKYEVRTGDAIEIESLPFVMGVMADLKGQAAPGEEVPSLAQREFQEFTHGNFDQRMKAIKPRIAVRVPNHLGKAESAEQLSVEATFSSMDDFQPAKVAQKIPPLAKLLKLREQIDRLLAHLDGNEKAEQLIGKLLNDPAMLQAMSTTAPGDEKKD